MCGIVDNKIKYNHEDKPACVELGYVQPSLEIEVGINLSQQVRKNMQEGKISSVAHGQHKDDKELLKSQWKKSSKKVYLNSKM